MAALDIVVCKYCKMKFNKKQEPWVKISTRYAHQSCYEQVLKQQEKELAEKQALQALQEYIMKLYDIDFIPPFIQKQIKEFKEKYKFTYSGMHKSLIWFFEIQKKPFDKNKGIGIIPYIYKDAEQYYYTIYLAKLQNKDTESIKNSITIIQIPSPKVQRKTFLIDYNIDTEGDN